MGRTWDISIHTTTRVVTKTYYMGTLSIFYFNPHHYESGDFLKGITVSAPGDFNPHHYESGDSIVPCHSLTLLYFNPHHYESGDPCIVLLSLYITLFQSTPLREW